MDVSVDTLPVCYSFDRATWRYQKIAPHPLSPLLSLSPSPSLRVVTTVYSHGLNLLKKFIHFASIYILPHSKHLCSNHVHMYSVCVYSVWT